MSYNLRVSHQNSKNTVTIEAQEHVKNAVTLTRGENYAAAIDIFEYHLSSLANGDLSDKRAAAAAFSYYGLCVAMVRRRYAEAVKYCNISLKANFLDPDHRYNLALVYLERNDRKKAVETLNAGLRVEPNNTRINVVFDSIGRRNPPPITFLPRDNPLNIWLGKLRGAPRQPG